MNTRAITTGNRIIDFYCHLLPDFALPEGVSIMHPYRDEKVKRVISTFYGKFYKDTRPRILILGINPGRLGAGITGIAFTDPVLLKENCGIANDFDPKKELSGAFIYEMIAAYGGPEKFYGRFLLSSLCPLGFIKEGKNVNYYDHKELQRAATPFILESLLKQKAMMGAHEVCLCLGGGKNYQYFCNLNKKHHLFSEILPLPHPRWVMQYRRKQKETFINLYLEKMEKALSLIRENK